MTPADSASPLSERDGSNTQGTEGGSGAVAQYASARRGEESAEFAEHAAALAVGAIMSVVINAPPSLRVPELLAWVDQVKVGSACPCPRACVEQRARRRDWTDPLP